MKYHTKSCFHAVMAGLNVKLPQIRVTWGQEASVEESPPADWPAGMSRVFLFND